MNQARSPLALYRALRRHDLGALGVLLEEWRPFPEGQWGTRLRAMEGLLDAGRMSAGAETRLRGVFLEVTGALRFPVGLTLSMLARQRGATELARKVARSIAPLARNPLQQVALQNHLGNLDLYESRYESALCQYLACAAALENAEREKPVAPIYRIIQLDNTGYVLAVLGRGAEGRSMIREALRCAQQENMPAQAAEARQDLSFSHSLENDWCAACLEAEAGLALGREVMPERVWKNLLVLLGHGLSQGSLSSADVRMPWVRDRLAEVFPNPGSVIRLMGMTGVMSVLQLKG